VVLDDLPVLVCEQVGVVVVPPVAPPCPSISTPINGTTLDPGETEFTLSWSAAEGAESYAFFVWPSSDPQPDDPTGTTAALSVEVAGLTLDTEYSIKILAIGPGGTSSGCGVNTVTTQSVPVVTPCSGVTSYDDIDHSEFTDIVGAPGWSVNFVGAPDYIKIINHVGAIPEGKYKYLPVDRTDTVLMLASVEAGKEALLYVEVQDKSGVSIGNQRVIYSFPGADDYVESNMEKAGDLKNKALFCMHGDTPGAPAVVDISPHQMYGVWSYDPLDPPPFGAPGDDHTEHFVVEVQSPDTNVVVHTYAHFDPSLEPSPPADEFGYFTRDAVFSIVHTGGTATLGVDFTFPNGLPTNEPSNFNSFGTNGPSTPCEFILPIHWLAPSPAIGDPDKTVVLEIVAATNGLPGKAYRAIVHYVNVP